MTRQRIPLILATILLILSASVPIFRFITTPSGRVFSGIQFYSDDYAVYAHTIMQGLRGRLNVVDKFTSEQHQGSLFHIQYLLIGLAFSPFDKLIQFDRFGLPPAAVAYHLSRFFFGALALWSAWQFTKEFFSFLSKKNGEKLNIIALILILFSGIFPKSFWPISWQNLEPFFREPDTTTRFASQPHFLTGAFALLFIFTHLLRTLRTNSVKPSTLLIITLFPFLVSFTDPTSVLMIAATLALFTFFSFAVNPSFSRLKIPLLFTLTIILSLTPSALYFRSLRSVEPWATIAQFDQNQNFNFSLNDFLPTFGIPLLLAPIGLYFLFKKKHNSSILLLSWITAFFLLFYFFAPILQINRLRLFHTPLFIGFNLLAAYSIFKLTKHTVLITILVLLPTLPTTIASLRGQLNELSDHTTLVYPSVQTHDALNYLKHNTPESSVVAALYEAGSILPYFSGNTSFAGNLSETLNYGQKSELLFKFLSAKMTPKESSEFLKNNRINYIFWGPQEKSVGGNIIVYPFLKVVYSNSQVDILKIN